MASAPTWAWLLFALAWLADSAEVCDRRGGLSCSGDASEQDSLADAVLDEQDDEAEAMEVNLLQKLRGSGDELREVVEERTPELERQLAALQGRRAALAMELEDVEAAAAAEEATVSDNHWYGCKDYGCGTGYDSSHYCQCNEACKEHHNCCDDYDALCASGGDPSPSPSPEPANDGMPFGHPDPNKEYPQHDGFTLMLVEEFDEPLDLDNDPIWTWSDGGLSEGIVRFVKEGITFEGGKMKIQAREDLHVPTDKCSHAEVGYVSHKRLTSGEIRSKWNMFRYGRYEVRMKAPTVQHSDTYTNGNYISTMFVYRDAKFKHWREIDIEVTGDSPHSVTTNVLRADNTDHWSPSIAQSKQINTAFNTRSDFHTYAFEWLPNKITWTIDGQVVRTHTHGIPIPDLSGKIMMNLWIFGGGGFGGRYYYNNRYPMHNEYDWFRFYKWDGDDKYPCTNLTDSCLTADDKYLTGNNPCDGIPQVGRSNVCHATCHP